MSVVTGQLGKGEVAVRSMPFTREHDALKEHTESTTIQPLLSVIIPFWNESATLHTIVQAVQGIEVDTEIILVDDASTDASREIAVRLAEADSRTIVVGHDRNLGKGAAIRTGLAAASGRFVIVQDADLEYDPAEIPKLLQPLIDDQADVVYGSRFLNGRHISGAYKLHALGNRALTTFSNWMTGLRLTDMETCYKAIRRDVLQEIAIEENRFGFEPEITAKLARYRIDGELLRVHEVAISYRGRTFGEGKKITWRDGVRATWCIVRYGLLG